MSVHVDPRRFEMGATESFQFILNAAPLLTGGATLQASGLATTLVDLLDNTSYAEGLSGSPSISGATVVQRVHHLVVDHHYRLTATVTDSAANTWEMQLDLDCA